MQKVIMLLDMHSHGEGREERERGMEKEKERGREVRELIQKFFSPTYQIIKAILPFLFYCTHYKWRSSEKMDLMVLLEQMEKMLN